MASGVHLTAEWMIAEELQLFDELSKWIASASDLEQRKAMANGFMAALEQFRTPLGEDPLAAVDDPLEPMEAAQEVALSEVAARGERLRLLAQCVRAERAGQLTGRSRQAVERQRRDGRVLAIREGRQWRYPVWQFDKDGPGGLLPGLPKVLEHLRLSPSAAAFWFTTPRADLEDLPPIELLRRRNSERVIELAEQLGYLP